MKMKKKLDIGRLKDRLSPEPARRHGIRKFLGAAALAIFLLAIFFMVPKSEPQNDRGRLDVYLEGPHAVMENTPVKISAFSSCGEFSTFVDGVAQGRNVASASVSLILPPGTHRFEAKNSNCSDNVSFSVQERECDDGQVDSCSEGMCTGNKSCRGGRWGGCIMPKRVCPPGQKIGCSIDGCNFGYTTCNACGSGFGNCIAANATSNSSNAASNCSDNGCG